MSKPVLWRLTDGQDAIVSPVDIDTALGATRAARDDFSDLE
jgi:hypothetical protein